MIATSPLRSVSALAVSSSHATHSLSHVVAPMMQINDDYYERLTEDKVDKILADLRATGTSPLKSGPYMWPESTR